MRPPRLIGDEPSPEVAAICDPLRGAAKGMPRQGGRWRPRQGLRTDSGGTVTERGERVLTQRPRLNTS